MKLHLLIALAVGLLIAADDAKQKKGGKKALKQLEGTWVMVSGEDKGEKLPEDTIKNAKLTMDGDKHTVKLGDATIVGTHKVKAKADPKEIDATDTEGPFKGETTLGIYKLEGDTFTVCFAPPNKERPKEFTSKSGTGQFVHVWKRQ